MDCKRNWKNFSHRLLLGFCTVKQFSYFDYSVDGHYKERNGPESPMVQVNTSHVFNPAPLRNQVQQTRDLDNRQSRTASTATKELDDLMASLSDFKVNVSTAPTPSQSRLSGDYAKPTKSKQQLPCMWWMFTCITFHLFVEMLLLMTAKTRLCFQTFWWLLKWFSYVSSKIQDHCKFSESPIRAFACSWPKLSASFYIP